MISLYDGGVYLVDGSTIVPEGEAAKIKVLTGREASKEQAVKGNRLLDFGKAQYFGKYGTAKVKIRCHGIP